MQFIEGSYAIYFNTKYHTNGHLFQGRFKDILVEKDEYLLELSRYIHLNPVKAGFVSLPEQYKWSSYQIYIGVRRDILMDTSMILNYFSNLGIEDTQKRYKAFIDEGISIINDKRDWLKDRLMHKRFLGSHDFVKNLLKRGQTPLSKKVY